MAASAARAEDVVGEEGMLPRQLNELQPPQNNEASMIELLKVCFHPHSNSVSQSCSHPHSHTPPHPHSHAPPTPSSRAPLPTVAHLRPVYLYLSLHDRACAPHHRWHNYLDPRLNLNETSEEEDARIMEAVRIHGTRWSVIRWMLTGPDGVRTAAWPK